MSPTPFFWWQILVRVSFRRKNESASEYTSEDADDKKNSYATTPPVNRISRIPINTSFFLKNYVRTDGTQQVYISISSKRERRRIFLETFVPEKHWDSKRKRVKKNDPNAEEYNLILERLEGKISKIKIHYKLIDKKLDIETFVNELFNESPVMDFIVFMKEELKTLPYKQLTINRNMSEINKLEEFQPRISFSQLNIAFFDRYKGWLFHHKKNGHTTIASSMKTIKNSCISLSTRGCI